MSSCIYFWTPDTGFGFRVSELPQGVGFGFRTSRKGHVWHLPESTWILKILGFWILDSGSRYTDPSNRCENPELKIQIPFLGSGFLVLISLGRSHRFWRLVSGFRILGSGF